MKHFFHQRQTNHDALLEHVLSGFNEAYDKSDITEQLKILYDATDIIHDKRLPEADDELETCFTNSEYKKLLFTESFNKKIDKKQLKYKALLSLWRCAEKLGEELTSDEAWLLFHLTRGNICNRLSQYFYAQYDFDNSEIWGDCAIEIIWHGINLAKQGYCEEHDIYLRLLQLNLSVYYVDYSRRSQRNSYASAVSELNNLIKKIREKTTQSAKLSDEIQRQYSLIKLEAVCDLIAICRRRFQNRTAEKLAEGFERYVEKLTEETSHLDFYDIQRYRVLAKLGLARIYRDLHEPKLYDAAINLALEADKISNSKGINSNSDKNASICTNIDAIIIISSVLRKALKYSLDAQSVVKHVEGGKFQGLSFQGLFNKLSDLAGAEHGYSKSELVKWYCMSLHNSLLLGLGIPKKQIIDGYLAAVRTTPIATTVAGSTSMAVSVPPTSATTNAIADHCDASNGEKNNIQLQLLKGILLLNTNQYTKARDLFLNLIKSKGADFIRLGTIGLKARYLLANTFMSLGQFSRAKSILQEIFDALKEAKEYRENTRQELNDAELQEADLQETEGLIEKQYPIEDAETDAECDTRTLIDLIYCYMRQGNYEKAYDMYSEYYTDVLRIQGSIKIDEKFLGRVKQSRRIAGINNLIACCIFTGEQHKERLQVAVNAFDYLRLRYGKKIFSINPEINLLCGYFALLTGKEPIHDLENDKYVPLTEIDKIDCGKYGNLELAHKYFKRASSYEHGFSPIYNLTLDNKETDKAYFSNHAVYVSAYLISLIRLAENRTTATTDNDAIKQFLLGLPKRYEITLNAAIALAEWLLNHKNTKNTQLLRSFCFATICEERGAGPFNQLRNNKIFRLLASEQRGEVMARLLCFYKHIKKLKEECTYSLDERQHLVHYTTLETLKCLLKDGARLRLSNCGYMNDVFEGREFLKCMGKIAANSENDISDNCTQSDVVTEDVAVADGDRKDKISLFEKYFPHLERSEKDMQPSGSNVYIVSLSVKEDSFHLWKIYSNDESGCNIEFDEDFFDVNGKAYEQSILRDYMPFRYTDEDYPLYVVQYIGGTFATEKRTELPQNITGKKYTQAGKTKSIDYKDLEVLLTNLYKEWSKFDNYLEENFQSKVSITQELRQFIADRLNEVRFLFKSSDYEFEGEVRVVHTTEDSNIDDSFTVPRVYISLDREIKKLTVRLGSRIDDAIVDQLVTWLKHSPLVDKVKLAERNRYISGSVMGRKRQRTGENDRE